MALLTLNDVSTIAAKTRPWAARMEFTGPNPANTGGYSQKFWQATGRGTHEPVEVSWGAIGSAPQGCQLVTWKEFRDRVKTKLANGYDWVDIPFFRMSPANLALLGGQKPAGTVPVSPFPLASPPTPALTVAPTQAAIPPKTTFTFKTPIASLLALSTPWNLVRALRVVRDGITVKGFDALDDQGNFLLRFDEAGGRDFAREYDVDMLWTSTKKI